MLRPLRAPCTFLFRRDRVTRNTGRVCARPRRLGGGVLGPEPFTAPSAGAVQGWAVQGWFRVCRNRGQGWVVQARWAGLMAGLVGWWVEGLRGWEADRVLMMSSGYRTVVLVMPAMAADVAAAKLAMPDMVGGDLDCGRGMQSAAAGGRGGRVRPGGT